MEATLLPWRAGVGADGLPSNGPSCHHIIGPQGHIIAHLPYDRFGKADADLIVKAANAHDRLIEALELAETWFMTEGTCPPDATACDQCKLERQIRAALALARGEVVA